MKQLLLVLVIVAMTLAGCAATSQVVTLPDGTKQLVLDCQAAVPADTAGQCLRPSATGWLKVLGNIGDSLLSVAVGAPWARW